jgi:uncharacterized membrane protein YbhN (UPF0104 family)
VGIVVILQAGPLAGWLPGQAAAWISALLLLPLAYLALLWAGRFPFTGLVHRLPGPLVNKPVFQKMAPLFRSTEKQISSLLQQKPSSILWVMLASALIWLFSICEYWLAVTLLGGKLDAQQTISALTAARLAFLTPLPGGLGALEASQALAMQALGLSAALGISLSLWIRARDLCLGLLGLGWTALSSRFSVRTLPLAAQGAATVKKAAQAGE